MSQKYFEAENANELYLKLIKSISEDPEYVTSPRGMDIKENIGVVAKIHNPLDCLITIKERKMNYAFAAIEKLEYLSGQTDAERLIFYNQNFANYSGDYGYFDGAYSERLQYWFKHIVALLKKDRDSRQAVVSIYGPQDRHTSKDIPCTVIFQFIIRNNKLNMIAYMRSNDLLWGVPYDTNGFCFIQEAIASLLGVELGTYELHAGSLHIYTEREDQLLKLLDDPSYTNYKNPQIPSYKNLEYSDLRNDLNKFWVAEDAYRKTGAHSNVIDELPEWLVAYYNIVTEYATSLHNKKLNL
jgi:thymidylate synthase